ncbi:hypothetical protein ACIP6P_03565 [Streptomyces sp. NPDC088729]|uniref:hypothetical protein n=1 Tax=Streptomyces sp. NPDC088729 TaxID=3365876 RepID=UPI003809A803
MTVQRNAAEAGAFAPCLRELTARLDPGRGWYGVFTRRDPAGMRACLEGAEIPPWDVVESLLADLAALHGPRCAEQVSVPAAALYAASVAAHDRRPGGRQELVRRLELMIREQAGAAERLRTAAEPGGGPFRPDAAAWARDDHERATARCAELRGRLAAVTAPAAGPRTAGSAAEPPGGPTARTEPPGPDGRRGSGPTAAPPARRKKPRGARFAGLEPDEGEAAHRPGPHPVLPATAPSGASAPRGARFGGGAAGESREQPGPAPARLDPAAAEEVAAAVARLVRLRREGRGGEAHVVLCEVASWPADRLPVLAVALSRAGLSADWTTLLWEASSLPPTGFAAVAAALSAAGRDDDCGLLLRQGVSRPAAEVADAVLALADAGREHEARALLRAYVRVRTPEEAASVARCGGPGILPHLLPAAREVSEERAWDLVRALRVAGVPGV